MTALLTFLSETLGPVLLGWLNQAVLHAQCAAYSVAPLLAQRVGGDGEEEAERPYSLEVALIMLCVILGIILSLKSSKRTEEIKKAKNLDE